MTGPYLSLQHLRTTDDATTMAIYLLKQYVTGRAEDISDIMNILSGLEDNRPHLEAACDQMRCAFAVPPWDREQKKWLGHKAFNMIVNEINKPSETQYQIQPVNHHVVAAAA